MKSTTTEKPYSLLRASHVGVKMKTSPKSPIQIYTVHDPLALALTFIFVLYDNRNIYLLLLILFRKCAKRIRATYQQVIISLYHSGC